MGNVARKAEVMVDLSVLWKPMTIGSLEVSNRVFISAHQTAYDPDRLAAYMGERARGGPGLLIAGALAAHPTAVSAQFVTRAWEKESIPAMAKSATAVHSYDSKLFGQLHHPGHNEPGNANLDFFHAPMAPSAIPSPALGRYPRAAEVEEIKAIVASFAQSAVNLREAGYDGVEIHAAHGYLIHSFLSPLTNKRTDDYGGSAENRARFLSEILTEVKAAVGSDFPVIIRLSLDEFVGPKGLTAETGIDTLEVIHRQRLADAYDISGSNYGSLQWLLGPASSGKTAVFADSASAAMTVAQREIPVMLAGSIMSLPEGAGLIENGVTDFVGLTRAQIADPELVLKTRSGRQDEVRTCIRMNQGCWKRLRSGRLIACTINPAAGREDELAEVGVSATPTSVVVVGGGPAGLQAAETAAKRGHTVTLLERSDRLGGQLVQAAELPNRAQWMTMVDELVRSLERLGVEVRLSTTATPELLAELGAAEVVVATGSRWDLDGSSFLTPTRDPLEIANGARVVDPITAIDDLARCGQRVVIIDDSGEYLPLGLAELLADSGREVEIVTARPMVGDKLGLTLDGPFVTPRLVAHGVRFTSSALVERVSDGSVSVLHTLRGEREDLVADTVVFVLGRTADDALYQQLRAAGVSATRIGDCLAPREVDDAIFEGMEVARTF
jgi:2,4-dienoyl-CoA reductase-like NADH-dependent reductase (Old Yellow Enzyme family)